MKKLKVLVSITILLTLLLGLITIVFANAEFNSNETNVTTPSMVNVGDLEYHLYNPSNFKTIQVEGNTYIRINSYVKELRDSNRDLGIAICFLIFFFVLFIIAIFFSK